MSVLIIVLTTVPISTIPLSATTVPVTSTTVLVPPLRAVLPLVPPRLIPIMILREIYMVGWVVSI